MTKNFDYQVVDKTNEGADIRLMDWIDGADYTEGQVIPRQQKGSDPMTEPNELATKQDLLDLKHSIINAIGEMLKEPKEESMPKRVSGKFLIEHHIAEIGGYTTLKRRLEQMTPEEFESIRFKDEGNAPEYDPQAFQDWFDDYRAKKKAERKIDPRLKLKGVI